MTLTTEAATIAGFLHTHSSTAAAAPSRTLAFAALITWLFDAASGGYMLRTWIARGGLRRQRASDRLAPRVVFGHFGMASTGLLIWVAYLATRWIVLAWLAVGLLMLVIGLGISTVTVWTPFPAHRADAAGAAEGAAGFGPGTGDPGAGASGGPAEDALTGALTDEMLNRALTDDVLLSQLVEDVVARARAGPSKAARNHRAHLAALIPASHGMAAITTMILAVLTAAGSR
jgi:hypothetical protein